jgi:hypothetical protein
MEHLVFPLWTPSAIHDAIYCGAIFITVCSDGKQQCFLLSSRKIRSLFKNQRQAVTPSIKSSLSTHGASFRIGQRQPMSKRFTISLRPLL